MRKVYFECKVLSHKILEFKKKNKVTYQQIGDALDVDKSYINRVVKYDSYPSLPVLIRLAKLMEVPLYALFIPSEELVRQEFIEAAHEKLASLNLSTEELEAKSGISAIRLMEILAGNSAISNEERRSLTSTLCLAENFFNNPEDKVTLLESLVNDLDLLETQKSTVIKYVKDNLK